MAGTTARGYPYPEDTDLINVAVDIQLLAEAINADMGTVISTGGQGLAANAAQDAIDRARTEAVNTALANAIAANTAQDNTDRQRMEDINNYHVGLHNAQQTSIDAARGVANSLYTGQRTFASNIGVTTDANAYTSCFYPNDVFGNTMFRADATPVVQISAPNRPPGYWLFGQVMGSQWNGFGSHWAYNTGPSWVVNASFVICYTATGAHP